MAKCVFCPSAHNPAPFMITYFSTARALLSNLEISWLSEHYNISLGRAEDKPQAGRHTSDLTHPSLMERLILPIKVWLDLKLILTLNNDDKLDKVYSSRAVYVFQVIIVSISTTYKEIVLSKESQF